MPIFEVQGKDGKAYEVDAPDMDAAIRGLRKSGIISGDSEVGERFSAHRKARTSSSLPASAWPRAQSAWPRFRATGQN